MRRVILTLLTLLLTVSCIYSQASNEIPKYGGIKKTPEMILIDEKFINAMVQEFGSREKAADDMIRLGFEYLEQLDWPTAMKRFNQAWLLSPDKSEVPWGFGAALSFEGKFEESEKYFQEAEALAPKNGRLRTDFGLLYQLWALGGTKDKSQRETRLNRSIELFEKAAELEPTYERTYFHWAVSLFYKKDYPGAWKKVNEAEKLGGKTISQKFIAELTKKMPRP